MQITYGILTILFIVYLSFSLTSIYLYLTAKCNDNEFRIKPHIFVFLICLINNIVIKSLIIHYIFTIYLIIIIVMYIHSIHITKKFKVQPLCVILIVIFLEGLYYYDWIFNI